MSYSSVKKDVYVFFEKMSRDFERTPSLLLNLNEEMVAAILLQFMSHVGFKEAQLLALEVHNLDEEFFNRAIGFLTPGDQDVIKARFPST